MGYVTNDPKKADDKLPGGHGLTVDLGLRACPHCRREVPEWRDDCPDCGVQAVAKADLRSLVPDIPAHLLVDEEDDVPVTDDSTDGELAVDDTEE